MKTLKKFKDIKQNIMANFVIFGNVLQQHFLRLYLYNVSCRLDLGFLRFRFVVLRFILKKCIIKTKSSLTFYMAKQLYEKRV